MLLEYDQAEYSLSDNDIHKLTSNIKKTNKYVGKVSKAYKYGTIGYVSYKKLNS